jgi:RNA polymerase sigma-70 factor (ECF subfamily)
LPRRLLVAPPTKFGAGWAHSRWNLSARPTLREEVISWVRPALPQIREAYDSRSVPARDPISRASALQLDALTHADTLFNLARRLTGSETDGEDLVQETYVRAFSALPRFRDGNLKAWLFRIMRNAFIDVFRKQREPDPLDAAAMESPDREVQRNDAELQMLRGLVAEQVEAAMLKLSLDARTVILLDLEGFTESEVAEILGCAPGTVKSRLCRARVTLRKILKEYEK